MVYGHSRQRQTGRQSRRGEAVVLFNDFDDVGVEAENTLIEFEVPAIVLDGFHKGHGSILQNMATLKDLMSNPFTEIAANGQALSDLASRISNRLANKPSSADVYVVPVQPLSPAAKTGSKDAPGTRLNIVELCLQHPQERRPNAVEHCQHCTACEHHMFPCPVNPLMQLTANA